MTIRKHVAPIVAGSPLVTIREGNVRAKPTHYGGKSLDRIAEQCSWNCNHTIPEIHLGSALLFKGINTFSYCLSQSGFPLLAAKSMLNYMNIMVIACKLEEDPLEEQEPRTRKLSEIKAAPLSSSPSGITRSLNLASYFQDKLFFPSACFL